MVGSKPNISDSLVGAQAPTPDPEGKVPSGRRSGAVQNSARSCWRCGILGLHSAIRLQRRPQMTGQWAKQYARNRNNAHLIRCSSCKPTYILPGNLGSLPWLHLPTTCGL